MAEQKKQKLGLNSFKAYAALKEKTPIVDFAYVPADLKSNEVELKILACGACHSDLHQVQNDWGGCNYPVVVGHEIVGVVERLGSAVKSIKLGQRVGVGPQTGTACKGPCYDCRRNEEELCVKKIKSYNTPIDSEGTPLGSKGTHPTQPYTYGGFSHRIRVQAKWAFPIPDEISTVEAAPLLCAGITTWTPFVHNKVQKGHKVGICGFGGLGHMAVQFAAKMGCETYVISRTRSKEREALKFGANALLTLDEAKGKHKRTFDFLLSTISADGVKWEDYLSLLKADGTLCCVGLPQKMSFRPNILVALRLKLVGSYLASHSEITKMLDFCAKHNVRAQVQTLEMTADNANLALKRIEQNVVRYRMVLVTDKSLLVAE